MKRILALVLFLVLLNSCNSSDLNQNKITIINGVLDLRSVSLSDQDIISLSGDWSFYWDQLADMSNLDSFQQGQQDFYIHVPDFWNRTDQAEIPIYGKAVYGLTILVRTDTPLMGLQFYNVNPNFTLYSNGQAVYTAGNPSAHEETSRAGNSSLVLPLVPREGRIDLVLTMSNWHTNKPGLFRTPQLGTYEWALKNLMHDKISDSLFVGGMFILGLFLLTTYLFNRDEKGNIWLALVVFSAALYSAVKGPMILIDLIPVVSGEIRSKIIYLVLLFYPFFTFKQYAAQKDLKIHRIIGKIDAFFVILVSAVVLLTNKGVYTRLELYFILHALLLSFYVIFVLFRHSLIHKTIDAIFSFLGNLTLFLAVLFSMMDNSIPLIASGLAGYFFVFCLFQTFLQAQHASKNLLLVKVLSERNRTLRDQKNQYENQALMDHLTRVKNRRSMDNYLDKSWDMCSYLKQGLGVIMVDIDFFKKYNDSLGHKEGDNCLVRVAEALSGSLKRNQDFIARYGGEEFIIIMQGVDSLSSLIAVAEHLRESVENLAVIHPDSECSPFVTISVGADYIIPGPESTAGNLIHRADTALYLAKNRGRNRVEVINTLARKDDEVPSVLPV